MNTLHFSREFVTFGDYAQFWLATKVDTKPTTRACYRSLLQCAAARFSDMPITEIERPDIMRWIVDLIDQREYDAGQVRAAHRVVHSTLALARSLGAIDSNPASDITLPRIRSQSPRLDRRLTLPELETLAQQIGWWKLVPFHEVPPGNPRDFPSGSFAHKSGDDGTTYQDELNASGAGGSPQLGGISAASPLHEVPSEKLAAAGNDKLSGTPQEGDSLESAASPESASSPGSSCTASNNSPAPSGNLSDSGGSDGAVFPQHELPPTTDVLPPGMPGEYSGLGANETGGSPRPGSTAVPLHGAISGNPGTARNGESRSDSWLAPHEPRPTPETAHRPTQILQVKGHQGYLARREERYGNRRWPSRKRRRVTRHTAPLPLVNQLEVLVLLLGYCGLRIGEALALTWGDIEWGRRIIHVRHAFTEVSGRLVLGTPKNGKTRAVPIPCFLVEGGLRRLFDFDQAVFVPLPEAPSGVGGVSCGGSFEDGGFTGGSGGCVGSTGFGSDFAVTALHEAPTGNPGAGSSGETWLDLGLAPHEPRETRSLAASETPRYTPGELRQVHIFRTLQDKPLRASNLRFHFALAATAIGEAGLHIHDLRHTAASLAVSAGANVKALAQMLGHSSAAMTLDVYADLFAEDLSGVAEALDGLRDRQLRG